MAGNPLLYKLKQELKEFQENIQPKVYKKNEKRNENISINIMYYELLQFLKQKYEDAIIYKNEEYKFYLYMTYDPTLQFCVLVKDNVTHKYNMFAVKNFFIKLKNKYINNNFEVRTVEWDRFFDYDVDEYLPINIVNDKYMIARTIRKKFHKMYQEKLYETYFEIFQSLFYEICKNKYIDLDFYKVNTNQKTYNIHIGLKSENQYILTISIYPFVKGYSKRDKKINVSINGINNTNVLEIFDDDQNKLVVNNKIVHILNTVKTIKENKEKILKCLNEYENEIENSIVNQKISKMQEKMNEYLEQGKDPIEYAFTYLSYMYKDMFELFKKV